MLGTVQFYWVVASVVVVGIFTHVAWRNYHAALRQLVKMPEDFVLRYHIKRWPKPYEITVWNLTLLLSFRVFWAVFIVTGAFALIYLQLHQLYGDSTDDSSIGMWSFWLGTRRGTLFLWLAAGSLICNIVWQIARNYLNSMARKSKKQRELDEEEKKQRPMKELRELDHKRKMAVARQAFEDAAAGLEEAQRSRKKKSQPPMKPNPKPPFNEVFDRRLDAIKGKTSEQLYKSAHERKKAIDEDSMIEDKEHAKAQVDGELTEALSQLRRRQP